MALKGLLAGDDASVAVEYVVFIAAVGVFLVVGVAALFNSMSGLFSEWANYFNATS
jgi:Flp pilus assembly pilin Flp